MVGASPEPNPLREELTRNLVHHAEAVCRLAHDLRDAATEAGRDGEAGRLTGRELQVVRLIAEEGLTNREIATRLGIRRRTVESHVEHIYSKIGVHSRARLTAWYFKTTPKNPAGEHE